MSATELRDIKALESFNYLFSAIRGIQAGREYYVTMCPLRLIPRLFLYDEEEIPPELRAQRTLNYSRIPEIANYIKNNPRDYIFSAITASVDGDVQFLPFGDAGLENKIGTLVVPMTARFIINDGQHRRAAIEEALKGKPEIGTETIAVVFFIDAGLKKSQQMFSDLNQHAVRPTRSLGILYDHRDPISVLSRNLAKSIPAFKGYTDFEKTTISNRSTKVFTLSSIYTATRELLGKGQNDHSLTKEEEQLSFEYWNEVCKIMGEWELLTQNKISSYDLRRDYVNVHGIALHAMGIVGYTLVNQYPKTWKRELGKLKGLDWSRSNNMWEGRAMIGGRISKTQMNLILTVNLLKHKIDLELSPEEAKAEKSYSRGIGKVTQ